MRIREKDLEILARQINQLTDSPEKPWTGNKSNVGNYHIDYSYGGVSLCRMTSTSGSIHEISPNGHGTKRELYFFMTGFIYGLTAK